MKLLKLLLHSAAAAVPFVALVALLPFYVSPSTPLDLTAWGRALLPIALVHGVLLTLLGPLVLLAVRFFAERPLDVPWFRFELWHRFHLADTALAAGVWWANFGITGALLPGPAHRRLLTGCGIITLIWALGALLSLQRVMFRTPRPGAAQGALTAVLFVALYLLRTSAAPTAGELPERLNLAPVRSGPRILVVAIEGLSPESVLPLAAAGRLPGMSRMMRDGARAPVRWHAPTLEAAAWTTVATGVLPRRHGIVDDVRWGVAPSGPRFTFAPRGIGFRSLSRTGRIEPLPLVSGDRRAPAIWNLLDAARLRANVVGWPATDPPESIRGSIVPAGSIPEAAIDLVLARAARLADSGPDEGAPVLGPDVERALARDLAALGEAARLEGSDRPAALLVHLSGLAAVQEALFREPASSTSSSADPMRGDLVARYQRMLDDALTALMGGEGPPDLVVVVSCWAMRRPPAWLQILGPLPGLLPGRPGSPPPGLLLVAGKGAAAGAVRPEVEPAEILPTLLYYLGLPVARDLDRRPRTDLFDAAFTSQRPITFVPTYRHAEGAPER